MKRTIDAPIMREDCLYRVIRRKYKNTAVIESLGDCSIEKSRYTIMGIIASEILYESEGLYYRKQAESEKTCQCKFEDILNSWCNIQKKGRNPFDIGAIGYIGYDTIELFEPKMQDVKNVDNIKKVYLVKYSLLYIIDKIEKRAVWVIEDKFIPKYDEIIFQIEKDYKVNLLENDDFSILGDIKAHFTKEQYLKAVNECVERIKNGDLLQANITMRFGGRFEGDPFVLYQALREKTPNPFFAFLDFEISVISTSPESFLKIEEGKIISSPIKGTIRCNIGGEDQMNVLKNSEKDHSENVMIADLIRNDIGRVSKIGTVSVPKLCEIRKFNKLYHLETVVEGELREDVTLFDILRWNFPGGSITGAPKVKAMQLIQELEYCPRNIYCGTIGYFGENGYVSTSIAIRVIYFNNDLFYLHGGGAIVVDSDAESEYQEMLLKVESLIEELQEFDILREERNKIDEITKKIVILVDERMKVIDEVTKKKKRYSIDAMQPNRVENIKNTIMKYVEQNHLTLSLNQVSTIIESLVQIAMIREEELGVTNSHKGLKNHPCFERKCGSVRMHMPVAPKCNIKCKYCNRKVDCLNETRPGVTSKILSPKEALENYIEKCGQQMIDVIGIAGPGDPLANLYQSTETFRLINEFINNHPVIEKPFLCLSTNGLLLDENVDLLYNLGVTYFTITINSLDERISSKIYEYVDYKGVRYEGVDAGILLKTKQIEALKILSQKDVHVKINMVYIEGVNDSQVVSIAKLANYYGCELLNIMPIIPVEGTEFYGTVHTDYEHLGKLKKEASKYISIMEHCMHCRADAFGNLTEGESCK